MKVIKTNAMRFLDKENIEYHVHTYESKANEVDGMHVCIALQENPEKVFKTLVCLSSSKQYYVFVVPVAHELDLKKCAKAVHEKNIELIPVKEIQKITGYIRGGCSPLGMKKTFMTTFHESCLDFNAIYFSGGKIGCQIEVDPKLIISVLHAQTANIIK